VRDQIIDDVRDEEMRERKEKGDVGPLTNCTVTITVKTHQGDVLYYINTRVGVGNMGFFFFKIA
jgi:hypothetical protein